MWARNSRSPFRWRCLSSDSRVPAAGGCHPAPLRRGWLPPPWSEPRQIFVIIKSHLRAPHSEPFLSRRARVDVGAAFCPPPRRSTCAARAAIVVSQEDLEAVCQPTRRIKPTRLKLRPYQGLHDICPLLWRQLFLRVRPARQESLQFAFAEDACQRLYRTRSLEC